MAAISFSNILYATDFSESSVPACDYALTLCQLTGARLHVLHVIGELTDNLRGLKPSGTLTELEQDLQKQSTKEMENFCRERFDSEIDYQTSVVVGTPFQEIIQMSEDVQADLIIMGTHGLTGIEHVIVGSTAERVVRRSTRPVMTVRSHPE